MAATAWAGQTEARSPMQGSQVLKWSSCSMPTLHAVDQAPTPPYQLIYIQGNCVKAWVHSPVSSVQRDTQRSPVPALPTSSPHTGNPRGKSMSRGTYIYLTSHLLGKSLAKEFRLLFSKHLRFLTRFKYTVEIIIRYFF